MVTLESEMLLPLDVPSLVKSGELWSLGQIMRSHGAIMLGFWAVWCSPRDQGLTSLAEMAASNRFSGLAFAAVNVDSATAAEADSCIRKLVPALPAYHEEPGGLFTRLLPVKFLPSAAVVAADGKVLYFGRMESASLRGVLSGFQNYRSRETPPPGWNGPDRRVT